MNDAILVEQALSGDHQAFHILITRHYTAIHNMILSWVRDSEDAKDLTQEVFISAYQNLPSLKRPESFYAWLQQIARRRCQNWQRNKQGNMITLQDDLISKEPPADEVLILRETLAKVMEAIDNLPESEKGLLKERYLDDTSYEELSARHGVSAKALVVRLVRTRRKIRDQLGKTLSAFVAFFHKHSEGILTGGVEIMKLSVKKKLIMGGIAVMLATGGTGVLVKHYSSEKAILQTSQESSPNLPVKSVSDNNGYSDKKVIQQVKIQADEQNMNEDYIINGDKGNTVNEPQKPLSYKEELRQRYHHITGSPEWKALNNEICKLNDMVIWPESYEQKKQAFYPNVFSAIGLTFEEGMKKLLNGEITRDEKRLIKETDRKFLEQDAIYRIKQHDHQQEQERLHQKQHGLLGMTDEEINFAFVRPYVPPPIQYVPNIEYHPEPYESALQGSAWEY